ncbi:hypothetical protein BKA56DRAFT_679133 [Ilyonectria sp. MPI-CAGE-AT-0026]|nr:hypothetical protein BKA56DRAFT_679133 [Ilyonectria sp. MPI-CAGE-AT-0026]
MFMDVSLPANIELHLISLYFSSVSLPVPIFSKANFYRQYEAGQVPSFLLNAMFSLCSRFSMLSEVLSLGNGDPILVGQYFSRKAATELGLISKNGQSVSISEVKATYLLAFCYYTGLPQREAWEQCSRVIRMAYMLRLHQLDNQNIHLVAAGSGNALDKEENRCLWWAIYTLDCFSSLTSFIPSGVDKMSLATSIPVVLLSETPVSGTSELVEVDPLGDKIDRIRCTLQNCTTQGAKTQAALIFAHTLACQAIHLRRLSLDNPQCSLLHQSKRLQQKWNSIFTFLPPWFFLPARHELDGTPEDYRQRLEVLNVYCITGAMSSAPPLSLDLQWPVGPRYDRSTSEQSWKACIAYVLNIAATYNEYGPELFSKANPITLPIAWTAGSLLALESMNQNLQDATEKLALLDALNIIMTSLQKTSRYWGIAEILLCSLQDLRGRAWIKLDLQAILQLTKCVWSPLMHDVAVGGGVGQESLILDGPENFAIGEITDLPINWDSPPWLDDELLSSFDWLGEDSSIALSTSSESYVARIDYHTVCSIDF